jgi:hypothetical protein
MGFRASYIYLLLLNIWRRLYSANGKQELTKNKLKNNFHYVIKFSYDIEDEEFKKIKYYL